VESHDVSGVVGEVFRMKVLLFGLTGYGNNAFKVLINTPSVEMIGVLTVKRPLNPFPYYECEKLHDVAFKHNIPLYEGLTLKEEKTYQLLKRLSPDMIVVSSFNQIIPQSIIVIPTYGVINVHPSLLPKYKGATPTVWMLMNDEKEAGVTVHFIENEKVDAGRIITQRTLKIDPSDNEGTLRCKLAKFSEIALAEALTLVVENPKDVFPLQNDAEATYYPKRTVKDAEIDLQKPFREILNTIRAMSPYPGARLTYDGKTYIVKNAMMVRKKSFADAENIRARELVVETPEGMITFYLA
jgi:methionyl-tRNA formyltransferase